RIFLNQRRASISLREISQAQANYLMQHPDAGYACSLSGLGKQGAVNRVLASGAKSGYQFQIQCAQLNGKKAESFIVTGVPRNPGVTGQYALCGDEAGEVWYGERGSISQCLAMRKIVESQYR